MCCSLQKFWWVIMEGPYIIIVTLLLLPLEARPVVTMFLAGNCKTKSLTASSAFL